jgi:hypothetical protein
MDQEEEANEAEAFVAGVCACEFKSGGSATRAIACVIRVARVYRGTALPPALQPFHPPSLPHTPHPTHLNDKHEASCDEQDALRSVAEPTLTLASLSPLQACQQSHPAACRESPRGIAHSMASRSSNLL